MAFEDAAATATGAIVDALGRSIVVAPKSGIPQEITAVFDHLTEEQAVGVGIEGERTWVECKASDANELSRGDEVHVDDEVYVVTTVERERFGLVTINLEYAG